MTYFVTLIDKSMIPVTADHSELINGVLVLRNGDTCVASFARWDHFVVADELSTEKPTKPTPENFLKERTAKNFHPPKGDKVVIPVPIEIKGEVKEMYLTPPDKPVKPKAKKADKANPRELDPRTGKKKSDFE